SIPILLLPPISSLFPYTTLFRSRLNKNAQIHPGDFVYISFPEVDGFKEMHPFSILRYDQAQRELVFAIRNWGDFTAKLDKIPVRSEEHTSELQSRFDLVCRLLLE